MCSQDGRVGETQVASTGRLEGPDCRLIDISSFRSAPVASGADALGLAHGALANVVSSNAARDFAAGWEFLVTGGPIAGMIVRNWGVIVLAAW